MPDYDFIKKFESNVAPATTASYNMAPQITQEDIYSSGRFPVFYLGQNNEEIYGQNQSTSEKWKNAAVKFAGTTATTFATGTGGLINGLYKAFDDGKFSSFYENDFNRSLDDFNKELDNNYANYYTEAEKNAAWYSPNTWGTANFWADTIFKNMGFAVGAYASGAAWSKGVGALVSGVSKAVSSSASAAPELAAVSSAENAVLGRTATAFNRLKTNLDNVAAKYLRADNITDFGKNLARAGVATSGEASIEAMHARESYRDKLIEEFTANGAEPNKEELEKIESLADQVGNATFGANMTLLTATNYIQFPKLPGTTWRGQRAGLNRIVTEGEDVLSRTYRATQPNKVLGAFRTASRFFSGSEAFEEGAQYVFPASIQDYVEKGRLGEEQSILSSLGEGLSQLKEKEGMISILSGGISGGIFETVGSGRRRFKERVDRRARTNNFINTLNSTVDNSQSFLRTGTESFKRGETLNRELNAAVIDNDRLQFEDTKTDLNLNYLIPRIQAGRFDLVQDDINGYLDLARTTDGWNRLIDAGVATEEIGQEQFIANTQKLSNLATSVNTQYEYLRDKYGSQRNQDGTATYSPDVLFQMSYGSAKIEDYTQRINQLITEIPSPALGIGYFTDLVESNTITEDDLTELADRIENMPNATPDYIEDVKQKAIDILELTGRRKIVRDQYEQIRRNPSQYTRPTQPIVPTESTDLQTPTENVEEEINPGDYDMVQILAEGIANGEDFSQDPDAQQLQETYPQLLEQYLQQIRDRQVAPKRQFAQENENTIFTFQGQTGNITYNEQTDQLLLNGLEITNSDINQGLVTGENIIDSSNYLSQEDTRTPLVERTRVVETLNNQLSTVQDRLNQVQQSIQDKKNELQNIQDELQVQQWNAEELVARKKGWFPQFTEAVDVLTELRNETQAELDILTEEQTQLQGQITELQDLIANPPQNIRSSIDLLENQIDQLESLVLENGDQINTLSDIIEETQSLIDRFKNIIRQKLETFQRNNPNIAVLETAIRAIDQNSPELVEILRQVQEIENFQIAPAQVRENQTRGQIQDLYKQIEEYDRQLQAKQALLNRLRGTQGEVQTRSTIEETITPQDIVTNEVAPETEPVIVEVDVNQSYEGAQKTADQVYNSTILLTTREERQSTPWYVKWEGFTQKYFSLPKSLRENLRMVLVTANNEESLGLTGLVNYMYKDKNGKPFFKTQADATNIDNGAVISVLVEVDPTTNDYYFVDQLGNRIENPSIQDVVANKMPSTSTTYATSNQQRAVEKDGVSLQERANAWRQERESIINQGAITQGTRTAPQGLESFDIGILGDAGKLAGARRTAELLAKGEEVTFTKEASAQAARDNELYNTEEIEGGVRVIGAFNNETNSWVGVAPITSSPRLSKFSISKGALAVERGVERNPQPIVGNIISEDQINEKGLVEVATSDNNFTIDGRYKQKKGTAWIKTETGIEQLIPRNLNEEEVNKIYDLLKLIKAGNQEQNTEIINYLNGLFHFNTTPNYGVLTVGDESFTLLEGNYLEQYEEQLKNALREARTSVNNDLVKENAPFQEVLEIRDGTPIFAAWQSYQGFLLSPTDSNGQERQPTMETMVNSGSYIDRYAILENINQVNNREDGDTIIQPSDLPQLNICS